MRTPSPRRRPLFSRRRDRSGTSIVETAFVLPVFLLMVLGFLELSHALMVQNSLRSACRAGARFGSTEGVTTANVETRIQELLSESIDIANLTVFVKDASTLDKPTPSAPSGQDIESLPSIELGTTETSRLFVVRGTVGYNEIAIIPMSFMEGVTLSSQSFMRHE